MKTRRQRLLAVAIGVILLLGTMLLWFWPFTSQVQVIQPQIRDVTEVLVTTGQLQVRPSSELSMNVSAMVETVHVTEGDQVRQGAVLLELEDDELERQVAQARASKEVVSRDLARLLAGSSEEELLQGEAQLDRAKAAAQLAEEEAARVDELLQGRVATPADLDRAQADVRRTHAEVTSAAAQLQLLERAPKPEDIHVAEARLEEANAALELARERLQQRRLKAPFDGTITRRRIDPGEAVSPGTPLLTLANMDAAEVFFETDENNVGQIALGQPARLIPLAFPERPFQAKVFQIGPEVDPERGVVGVRLALEESPPEVFFPEMTVDVNLVLQELQDAVSVPRSAVEVEEPGSFVYVVRRGRAERQAIDVRAEGETWVAVDALPPELPVVLRADTVSDGERVRPREVRPEEVD